MTKITLFSNPNSGQNRRNPNKIKKFESILGEVGEVVMSTSLEALQKDVDRWYIPVISGIQIPNNVFELQLFISKTKN